MQVVMCADVHLGGVKENKITGKDAFLQIIQTVQETRASLLLIAGDLFQADEATAETIQLVQQAFETIPDTYVFISPGNNDPATRTSCYVQEAWSENVFIFTEGLEAVELAFPETGEKVRIYGTNYQNAQTLSKTLSPENFPELDSAYINVLLLHGTPAPELLNGCGFDFCALGHIHQYSGIVKLENTVYAYPGACKHHGSKLEGGILAGTLTKETHNLTFASVTATPAQEVSVDISNMQSQEEITQNILQKFTQKEAHYHLTLTGNPAPQARFSITQLREKLRSTHPNMQVRARFSRDAKDVRPLLSGELTDYLVKEAEYVRTQQDPELVRLALEYALSVCPGSVQTPEEVFTREEFRSYED